MGDKCRILVVLITDVLVFTRTHVDEQCYSHMIVLVLLVPSEMVAVSYQVY